MIYKVFLSWQSQNKNTEKYIKEELKRTREELGKKGMNIELILSPTQDEAGSPDIKNSIVEQIKNCDVFVGDLSFVDEDKSISNGNVLYEVGIADVFLGEERVILVCDENTEIEKIAFDINHKRISKLDTRKSKSQLECWVRAAIEESDKNRYVKTYASDQFEEEILFLLNFFYKYINMPNSIYDGIFKIPNLDEIEGRLNESEFPAFILYVDFNSIINTLEEKMLRLYPLSHKRIIWSLVILVTKLKEFQKFCLQTKYSFVLINEGSQEQYNIYDVRNFFIKSKEDFSYRNKTILFLENSELLIGNNGTFFMDRRIFKEDEKKYKEKLIEMDVGYQRVIVSRIAHISNDSIMILSEIVYNILCSIMEYIDCCDLSIVFETNSILSIE